MSKISIYTTCYLVNQNKFNFLKNLVNFSQFADEVIVGTTAEGITDGTLDTLNKFISDNKLSNVSVVVSQDILFSDNKFDGAIKNFALSKTSHDICIQMDLDEFIPLWQKDRWVDLSDKLLQSSYDALLVPTIDVWGKETRIKQDSNIGYKFRIHKPNVRIGVLDRAKLDNGLIDTSISDTCDMISLYTNQLASAALTCPPECLVSKNVSRLNNFIFTVHLGFLDLKHKANLTNIWWEQKWKDRSGRDNNCETNLSKLVEQSTVEHYLKLY